MHHTSGFASILRNVEVGFIVNVDNEICVIPRSKEPSVSTNTVPTFRRPRWIAPLFSIALLLPVGCASLANQPNSPARAYHFPALNDPVATGDRYYLLVFGSQSLPKQPRYTHTWVTFVRVAPPMPGCSPEIEQHTISWMPSTLNIRTFNFAIEPGVNLSLHDSMKLALDDHDRISLWGPYEIPSGLFRKLKIQKAFVESGAIGYQCIDTVGESGRTGQGSNCVHAISDADATFTRQAYPLTSFGETASHYILKQLVERGAIKDVETKHDFLMPILDLQKYPIVRREYNPPLIPGPFRFGHIIGLLGDVSP